MRDRFFVVAKVVAVYIIGALIAGAIVHAWPEPPLPAPPSEGEERP